MPAFDPATDPAAFRRALGSFATGVTIVATPGPAGPVGITANSFASVSLDPPLVLWSPARASSRFAAMAEAERYAIHILAFDQRAQAEAMAQSGDSFGPGWATDAEDGLPRLEGALARFRCRRVATHPGGDHAIVVGLVEAAEARPGRPLLYLRGYRTSEHEV